MNLSKKRILVISVRLMGLPENIVKTLQSKGAEVDYFDERPNNSFIIKALIRIKRNLISFYTDRYHEKIINKTKERDYDYIIVIKGESLSSDTIKELLKHHPKAKSIIYHWDSIENNPNGKIINPYFDKVVSFDKKDCEKYNLSFLPLFYYEEYKYVADSLQIPKYDMLFIGTMHSDRYKLVTGIAEQIIKKKGKCYLYFFFQGRIMYLRYRVIHPEISNINKLYIHFNTLNKQELLELYKESKIIVDIQHPKQTGLTLRCFEALGAKRKLITTNSDIKNYDFYSPNNILIVDRDNPQIPDEFINSNFTDIPEQIYDKYSISSWIDNLLC